MNRDSRGVTDLETLSAVVLKMVHDCPCAVIYAREAGESGNDTAEAEGTGYRHDRTEEQLRLHRRQGDVPELLPAVLYAVNGAGLIKRVVARESSLLRRLERGREIGL